jgi:hypothetical protein
MRLQEFGVLLDACQLSSMIARRSQLRMCGFSSTCRANVEFAEKTSNLLQFAEIHFGVLPNGRAKLIASVVLIPNLQAVPFV